jgi:hypothetical protein
VISLEIVEGDLFETACKAILLPIDGSLPANASPKLIARSLGRLAREFSQRNPDFLEEVESQVTFPIPLGGAVAVELGERFVILVSMLSHLQTDDASLKAAIARGFQSALTLCDSLKLPSLATPILKGGWRISTEVAASLMLRELAASRADLRVEIRVIDQGAHLRMTELARSLGL